MKRNKDSMLISFIGGGNMATALIKGLKKTENPRLAMQVCTPSDEARARLRASLQVETHYDLAEVIEGADVIVLAVKPQVMPEVLDKMSDLVSPEQLVLSVAAGKTVASISEHLGPDQAIIRAMPNTPALTGHGITGIYAGPHCTPHHVDEAETILSATGEVVWVKDESLMDVVTAISGSGPAYYFLLTEALAAAGKELGLKGSAARRLAAHTCFGAGVMVVKSDEKVAELRRRVTSPGGTTQAALEVFEDSGFRQMIHKAVEAAAKRGRELAHE
jgi:pyrroline-5-carboxylate reductase